MTHHTDAERAEFEAAIRATMHDAGEDHIAERLERWPDGAYKDRATGYAWWGYQKAARRAPVAPVPQRCKPVPVELLERIQESLGSFVSDQGWSQSDMDTADALGGLLAAAPQPPEAAPVPQFSRIAQKKLDYLLEAGEAITGYAIENKDGRRGAIDCHGFVYWWQDAAAPQPPEVAPVQMPDLAGWIDDGGMVFWNDGRKPNDGEIIYTEQQVREILKAHGINVKKSDGGIK